MLRKVALLCCMGLLMAFLNANPVGADIAQRIANNHIKRLQLPGYLTSQDPIKIVNQSVDLAYLYSISPHGYILVSADDNLPPVIAYSNNDILRTGNEAALWEHIITTDLSYRIANIPKLSMTKIAERKQQWSTLLSSSTPIRLEQWPSTGGGWIKAHWTQSMPYNQFCPLDIAHGGRSYAGCPSIAMGQIVDYYQTFNGIRFDESDRYRHQYGGNNYWIDDDAESNGFPTFSDLNDYLGAAEYDYKYQEPQTNEDKAAIVFACGVAAQQVYGASGSGTFGVSQALAAYQRFQYSTATLLTNLDNDVNGRIAQNVINAMPVHYAIVTPDNNSGHNVVVDGYNTEGFYHVNFGWGAAYDGWYQLPDDLPMGLTVLEGAIVDISPVNCVSFTPAVVDINLPEQSSESFIVTVRNPDPNRTLTIEDYYLCDASNLEGLNIAVQGDPLPRTINYGDSLQFEVRVQGITGQNVFNSANLRVITANMAFNIPIQVHNSVINEEDQVMVQPNLTIQSCYPNPFHHICNIALHVNKDTDMRYRIYNMKGQLVKQYEERRYKSGDHFLAWDGKDTKGDQCGTGVYFFKISTNDDEMSGKILKF